MIYVRLFYWLFIVLIKNIQAENISFVVVDGCPSNKADWISRAEAKHCQVPPDYFCASIYKHPGRFGEICTKKGLISSGHCGVLHSDTYNFDYKSCRAIRGCPDQIYSSSELYKFPVCFTVFYSITTQTSTLLSDGTTTISKYKADIDENSDTGIVLGLMVPVVILVTAVIIFVLYRQNKLPGVFCCRNTATDSEGLEENSQMIPVTEEHLRELSSISGEEHVRILSKIHKLSRYLKHILKTELQVWDLREKLLTYSVSLNEHLGERLLKDLENVNNTEDYDNFDVMVVFTLLINFCDNVKPPETGWGYTPNDDDHSLRADIERIHILWNLYCDDQVDIPNLQDVYRRISETFGELSNNEYLTNPNKAKCNALESKIKISHLRRNCDLENGIVVTRNIKSSLALLNTSDIVICVGAIGCGKTTAMRYIQDRYEDKGWRTVWFEEYINENELMENEIKDSLLCCDNLFGAFNCNVFSLETVTGFEHIIQKQREICKGHLKCLLGIHQHVYDAALKFGRVRFMDTKNLIDIDHLDKAEMLLIWKELKKESHCVHGPSCWFKNIEFTSVSSKLLLNQGIVGNAFLMLMYCKHHDFFSNEEFTKSPVTRLVNHFKRMKEENKELFFVLVYIMFIRVYNVNQDVMPWAGSLSEELTEESIKRCVKKYPEYLTEENDTVELKHELLNISLFKASYDISTVLSALVHHCDIWTILQLTRTQEECDCDFVNCLPPSSTDDKIKIKILKRIAEAKGCPFTRPHYLSRKWKKEKRNHE